MTTDKGLYDFYAPKKMNAPKKMSKWLNWKTISAALAAVVAVMTIIVSIQQLISTEKADLVIESIDYPKFISRNDPILELAVTIHNQGSIAATEGWVNLEIWIPPNSWWIPQRFDSILANSSKKIEFQHDLPDYFPQSDISGIQIRFSVESDDTSIQKMLSIQVK